MTTEETIESAVAAWNDADETAAEIKEQAGWVRVSAGDGRFDAVIVDDCVWVPASEVAARSFARFNCWGWGGFDDLPSIEAAGETWVPFDDVISWTRRRSAEYAAMESAGQTRWTPADVVRMAATR